MFIKIFFTLVEIIKRFYFLVFLVHFIVHFKYIIKHSFKDRCDRDTRDLRSISSRQPMYNIFDVHFFITYNLLLSKIKEKIKQIVRAYIFRLLIFLENVRKGVKLI